MSKRTATSVKQPQVKKAALAPTLLDDLVKETIKASKDEDWHDLGSNKKVRMLRSTISGKKLFDLRKFDDCGEPTTGIILDEMQAKLLLQLLPTFQRVYEEVLATDEEVKMRENIGRDVFLSLDSSCLCADLRKFFIPRGSTSKIPTKKTGVAFTLDGVRSLIAYLKDNLRDEETTFDNVFY